MNSDKTIEPAFTYDRILQGMRAELFHSEPLPNIPMQEKERYYEFSGLLSCVFNRLIKLDEE